MSKAGSVSLGSAQAQEEKQVPINEHAVMTCVCEHTGGGVTSPVLAGGSVIRASQRK